MDAVTLHSHAALAEINARHGGDMHRLALRLRGPAWAEDVVQDVLLSLWCRPGRFDPARGSLRQFLMMQTRTRAIDLLRSDTNRRVREDVIAADVSAVSPRVDDCALARLQAVDAGRLLSGLGARERNAIVLAYFGDHSYREVALLLGHPEGTIKTRIRSGLGRLRHVMVTGESESSVASSR